MNIALLLFAVFGLWLMWSRWPRLPPRMPIEITRHPKVSIIVPARNERLALPTLLASLAALTYPDYEVIVLNDQSDDDTAEIAKNWVNPRIRFIDGSARPPDWRGKQWACHQGASEARGELLLFTDADTTHAPDSLLRSVAAIQQTQASMLTALPHHKCQSWWEKATGPFHVFMLTVTAPYVSPTTARAFAIGQYLLFDRQTYWAIGGHAAVKDEMVEDLPLAKACLTAGKSVIAFVEATPLFEVRMYASLAEFVAGWRRNVRAGLSMSSLRAPVEITAMLAALFAAGHNLFALQPVVMVTAGIGLLARAQRRLGQFSIWGAVCYPLSVGLFCLVTLLAVYDTATGRPQQWKGRTYPSGR